MKTDHIDELNDREFGAMLRRELPQAPRDEWFVRKTMNRLPPKQKRIFSPGEIWVFAFAVLFMIAWGVVIGRDITRSEMWTSSDMINGIAFICTWIVLAWNIMARVLKTN